MAVINEIFNPRLKLPESTGHYKLPEQMSADDHVSPQDLDIAKLAELKEVCDELQKVLVNLINYTPPQRYSHSSTRTAMV